MATRVKTELTGLSKFESSKFKERRENSWRLFILHCSDFCAWMVWQWCRQWHSKQTFVLVLNPRSTQHTVFINVP